jgi:Bacteriocin-protection, YdeI or OmpD-Associated
MRIETFPAHQARVSRQVRLAQRSQRGPRNVSRKSHQPSSMITYTHRREYAPWIDEAKREETRQRRISEALELPRQGKTRT